MARYVALLIVGVIIGGGIVFATSNTSSPPLGGRDATAIPAAGSRSASDDSGSGVIPADLSPANRFAAEADQIEALAEHDLARAIAMAMARDGDSLRKMLLVRAGEGAARRDPIAALAQAQSITDLELRQGLTLGIMNTWTSLDPSGLLEFLETAEPASFSAPAFDRLVLGDPEAVLDRLDNFPGLTRQAIERAALLALAETDAIDTLARLDSMPPGQNRTQLMLAVAETYGRQDPSAALAWVTSQSPPSQAALNGVVNGIAAVDVNQAIDWVLREIQSPTLAGLDPAAALPVAQIFRGLRTGALPMPLTAQRLLAAGDSTLKSRATSALMVWAQEHAAEAVNFTVARLDQFDPGDLTALAMQTAESAPDVALQTADRLPPEYRTTWVAGVADALVRNRPQRALDYLAGQRGQPGYEEGVVAVVRQLAPADPEAAATLITDSNPSPQIANAARIVASAWANDDAGAARQWVLGLPSGEARDAGIVGVLTAVTNAGAFDATLLDAMSSNAMRQQAASTAILQIGRTDQARARELIQTHISDPVQQAQLEQQLVQLARFGAAGANVPRLPTINFDQ